MKTIKYKKQIEKMNQEEYIMIIIDKNGLYKGNGEKVNANDVASEI